MNVFKDWVDGSVVKSLLHKHEELSLDPQHSPTKPAVVAHSCDYRPGRQKQVTLEGLLASHSSPVSEFYIQRDPV